ncbi:hypothetical protein [Nonomuraea sp. NPDC003201]
MNFDSASARTGRLMDSAPASSRTTSIASVTARTMGKPIIMASMSDNPSEVHR